jgi:hypothetical protein
MTMGSIGAVFDLAKTVSSIATLLNASNEATYAADLEALKADGEKLLTDAKALLTKLEADAKTAGL